MRNLVLIDSSAWIEFFNDRKSRDVKVSTEVRRVMEDDRAATTEPIFVEIAMGAKGKKQLDSWRKVFSVLRLYSVKPGIWLKSADNGYKLARRGITVPVVDLLIATIALENDLTVLHKDERHFPKMAGVLGFSDYTVR
jgi:hypothetical protein